MQRQSGYFTFLFWFFVLLLNIRQYIKLKNTCLRKYTLYSLNACERIWVYFYLEASIKNTQMCHIPGKHFMFFQENKLLFFSSLKENTLKTYYMLHTVLGAEAIQIL